MKTNGKYTGGAIIEDLYQAWADYFMKFFDSYADEGVEFWGVTTGNEPSSALIPFGIINSVGWTPSGMVRIKHVLNAN